MRTAGFSAVEVPLDFVGLGFHLGLIFGFVLGSNILGKLFNNLEDNDNLIFEF